MKLTEAQAEKIFDLLVAKCGANDRADDLDRYQFVCYMTDGSDWHEFRFQGIFGFGGKLYDANDRLYVGYYPEDKTEELALITASVNKELAMMRARFVSENEPFSA